MATVNFDFTSVGAGNDISLIKDDKFSYAVSGTFVGTVVIEQSTDGGATYRQVGEAITAPKSSVLTVNYGGSNSGVYRFRCIAYTSGTIETVLSDVDLDLFDVKDFRGKQVFKVTEAGIETFGTILQNGSPVGGGGNSWGDPVDMSIVPDTDNTYNLGSSAENFAVLYARSLASNAALSLSSTTDMTFSVANGSAFKMLETGNAPTIGDVWTATAVDGTGYWAPAAGGGDAWGDPVDADIVPDSTANNRKLGSAASTFDDLYIRNIRNGASGSSAFVFSSGTQITLGQDIIPFSAATRNLGNSSSWFNSVIADIFQIGTSGARLERNLLRFTGSPQIISNSAGNPLTISANGSGSVNLLVGTGGSFSILETGNAPSVGDVFTCSNVDGTGYWAAPAAGGGDLWSDPVDANIVPTASNLRDLGSSSIYFKTGFFNTMNIGEGSGGGLSIHDAGTLEYILGAGTQSSPSGSKSGLFFRPFLGGIDWTAWTSNTGSTTDSGSFHFETGNHTGTANSGSFNVLIGTSTGTQGEIRLLKSGQAPTVGQVWTATGTDGAGYWAAPAAGGATIELNNLGTTDLVAANLNNTGDILPNGAGTKSLGSGANPWGTLWLNDIRCGDTTTGQILMNSSGSTRATLSVSSFSVGPYSTNGRLIAANQNTSNFAVATDDQGSANSTATAGLVLRTGSKTNASSTANSGDIHIDTGDAAGTTGDSGSILMKTGTSANGLRGKIKLDALMATLPTGTADPTGQEAGDCYYKTDTKELRIYDGAGWVGVTLA